MVYEPGTRVPLLYRWGSVSNRGLIMKKRFARNLVIVSLTILLLAVLATIAIVAGENPASDFEYVTLSDSVSITKYKGTATEVVIPETIKGLPVKYIDEKSFMQCSKITSVVIPEGVVKIGFYAFRYCAALEKITIPQSLTTIGAAAFEGCSSLTGFEIPKGVTVLENQTFSGCSSLVNITIPDGVTIIKDGVFSGCGFTSIEMPDGVTSIGKNAFSGCSSLTNIDLPDSVTSIGDRAFSGCTSFTEIVIPNSVTSVGKQLFSSCSSLRSVTLPSTMTEIGDGFYEGCTSLSTMIIPENITSIGASAFSGCTRLVSIEFPKGLERIGTDAFKNCYSLIVVIDNSDEVVSRECVKDTYLLTNYPYVDNIYQQGTTNLKYGGDFLFYYPEEGEQTGILAYIGNKETVTLPKTFNGKKCYLYELSGMVNVIIPEGFVGVGDFHDCKLLKSIEFPEGMEYIGSFRGSSSLVSVVIHNGITSLVPSAFYQCTSLTSVIIPDSVTSIGDYAFSECTSLTSVVIPDSVTDIGNYAFSHCASLTSVKIPDSVTNIGIDVFAACLKLTSATIPNNMTSIPDNLFSGCANLGNITLPDGLISIGNYAFAGSGISNVVIPESVTSIGNGAFSSCKGITSIEIPKGITSIGDSVFHGCRFTSIVIPENITSLGDGAFSNCIFLTSVTIPDSVTEIGEQAFYSCMNLTYVVLGKKAESIGNQAFFGCLQLKSIIVPDSVTHIGISAFDNFVTLYGKLNGTADIYSRQWGNVFVPVDTFENEENGVSVLSYNDSVTPDANFICSKVDNTKTANIVIKTQSEKAQAFDIHFESDGKEIQPSSPVTVKIPIPENYDPDKCKIFHIRDNGVQVELGFVIENGCFVFSTDHFSIYAIAQYANAVVIEDKKYTVTWKNFDGTVLETDLNVEKGTLPIYNGATPTRPSANGETFAFVGWSPIVSPVTFDVSYTALFSSVKTKYTIIWKNDDGTILKTETINAGSMPVYGKDDPTKKPTDQYTFTFKGWSPEITSVTENATYTATYTSTTNKYRVTWCAMVDNKLTILRTDDIEYGTIPSYGDSNPTVEGTAQYTYSFSTWDRPIVPVTNDAAYVALFKSFLNRYTVTWNNYDGTVLETDEDVDYGTTPSYDGPTPTKPKDGDQVFKFMGWTPSVTTVSGDVTYTAVFQKPDATVTVTWKNYDGTVLQVVEDLELGTTPSYTGTTPKRPEDSRYTYTFSGWTPSVSAAIVDVTYTATFTAKEKTFTVYWVNYNGEVLETDENVKYGSMPEYNGSVPTRSADSDYEYTFAGWSPSVSSVTKNITYTAQFSVNGQTIETTEETTVETTTETTESTETTVETTEEVTTENTEVTETTEVTEQTTETTEEITTEVTEVVETTETTEIVETTEPIETPEETSEKVTTVTTEEVEATETTQTVTDEPETVFVETKWDAKAAESSGGLTIKSGEEVGSDVEVRVNGKVLDRKYYDVFDSSTIVIKNSYLETLPNGSYKIEVVSKSGVADAKFEVVNSDVPADNANNSSTLIIIIAVVTAVVIIAVVVVIVVVNKKKKEED